jgi:hypothetical protein
VQVVPGHSQPLQADGLLVRVVADRRAGPGHRDGQVHHRVAQLGREPGGVDVAQQLDRVAGARARILDAAEAVPLARAHVPQPLADESAAQPPPHRVGRLG